MQALRISQRTGKDGVLRVNVPLGTPDADYEVVLVVQPKATEPTNPFEERRRPPRHFDLAGSINDPTFMRPPQGELPRAVEFD